MKKSSRLFLSLTIIITSLFTACSDPIFYNILRDVPPTKTTVVGNINTITRFTVAGKEFLVLAANEGIRYKPVDVNDERDFPISMPTTNIMGFSIGVTETRNSSWATYKLPDEILPHKYEYLNSNGESKHVGHQILKVLADTDTLYIVTSEYEDSLEGTALPTKAHLWALKISSLATDKTWSEPESCIDLNAESDYLPIYETEENGTKYKQSGFNVIGTNSIKPEHRKVFLKKDKTKGTDKIESDKTEYALYFVPFSSVS